MVRMAFHIILHAIFYFLIFSIITIVGIALLNTWLVH
jgi:hypothetical protein